MWIGFGATALGWGEGLVSLTLLALRPVWLFFVWGCFDFPVPMYITGAGHGYVGGCLWERCGRATHREEGAGGKRVGGQTCGVVRCFVVLSACARVPSAKLFYDAAEFGSLTTPCHTKPAFTNLFFSVRWQHNAHLVFFHHHLRHTPSPSLTPPPPPLPLDCRTARRWASAACTRRPAASPFPSFSTLTSTRSLRIL